MQAIILAPSRELVTQIGLVGESIFKGSGIGILSLIGGANVRNQIKRLRDQKPQIIVATPGRLAELVFQLRKLKLGMVRALVIDEVDKLKGAAMRTIITLYNECEDSMGLVIAGTDHLQHQMERDAQYNRKGAEELLSRFGRKFIHLPGSNASDVAEICRANGISDAKTIKTIFKDCEPVQRGTRDAYEMVVEDLRRVKRAVQKALLMQASPIPELN